jgi:hypothetical protein
MAAMIFVQPAQRFSCSFFRLASCALAYRYDAALGDRPFRRMIFTAGLHRLYRMTGAPGVGWNISMGLTCGFRSQGPNISEPVPSRAKITTFSILHRLIDECQHCRLS